MSVIEHDPIRPGQVWLCVEHLEDPAADCSCGLTPYLPRAEVETLERQLAGAVARIAELERDVSSNAALAREASVLREQLEGAVVVDDAALERAERWMLNEMHEGLSNRACVEAIVSALRGQ